MCMIEYVPYPGRMDIHRVVRALKRGACICLAAAMVASCGKVKRFRADFHARKAETALKSPRLDIETMGAALKAIEAAVRIDPVNPRALASAKRLADHIAAGGAGPAKPLADIFKAAVLHDPPDMGSTAPLLAMLDRLEDPAPFDMALRDMDQRAAQCPEAKRKLAYKLIGLIMAQSRAVSGFAGLKAVITSQVPPSRRLAAERAVIEPIVEQRRRFLEVAPKLEDPAFAAFHASLREDGKVNDRLTGPWLDRAVQRLKRIDGAPGMDKVLELLWTGQKIVEEGAVPALTEALRLNPRLTDAYWYRGLALATVAAPGLAAQSRVREACSAYEAAAKDFAAAAQLYEQEGLFDPLPETSFDSPLARQADALARMLKQCGHLSVKDRAAIWSQAMEAWQAALAADPNGELVKALQAELPALDPRKAGARKRR